MNMEKKALDDDLLTGVSGGTGETDEGFAWICMDCKKFAPMRDANNCCNFCHKPNVYWGKTTGLE